MPTGDLLKILETAGNVGTAALLAVAIIIFTAKRHSINGTKCYAHEIAAVLAQAMASHKEALLKLDSHLADISKNTESLREHTIKLKHVLEKGSGGENAD